MVCWEIREIKCTVSRWNDIDAMQAVLQCSVRFGHKRLARRPESQLKTERTPTESFLRFLCECVSVTVDVVTEQIVKRTKEPVRAWQKHHYGIHERLPGLEQTLFLPSRKPMK
jgi:hypothetical protein